VYVVAFAIHVHQQRFEVSTNLGEDMSPMLDRFAIQEASAVFRHKDQMNMHREDYVPTVSEVVDIPHRPDYAGSLLRRQGYQFAWLRPNGEQLRNMRRFAGARRFVFNKALARNNERYALVGRKRSLYQMDKLIPAWKKEFPWLEEVPSQTIQQALKDLYRGYSNFKEGRAKFPTFAKKGKKDSFRYPQGFEVDHQNGRMKLPKLGWMRYRKSQDILGQPGNVTVSESCGKWFVAIQTEREVATPPHPATSAVGLDWGVLNFATLSNGEVLDQCQPLKKFLPKLAKLQGRMAKKRKFSKNGRKAKARIAKLHGKIANIRKGFVHKVSNGISKNHVVVVVEDLQVQNMSKSARKNVAQKSGLNRSVLDASPFELRRQLEYKTQWNVGLLVAVPPQNTSRKVSSLWTRIRQESQDPSAVRLCPVRILSACRLRWCCEYQRGGTRLASLFVCFG
jgi:putative transposase